MDEHVQPLIDQPGTPPEGESKQPPPSATPPAASTSPQYEFTEEQNEVMKGLDAKLGATGGFLVLVGIAAGVVLVLELVKGTFPYSGWGAVVAVLVVLLILAHGVWLCNASYAFQRIHQTRGNDIDHLMSALSNLNHFFTLMALSATVILIGLLIHGVIQFFT